MGTSWLNIQSVSRIPVNKENPVTLAESIGTSDEKHHQEVMDHNQKLTTMSSEYFNHRGELGQRLRNAIQHETLHTRRYPILAAALGHGRPDSASQPPIAMAVGDLQHDQSTVTSTSDDQITSRYPILAAALMGGDGMTTQNQESVQI